MANPDARKGLQSGGIRSGPGRGGEEISAPGYISPAVHQNAVALIMAPAFHKRRPALPGDCPRREVVWTLDDFERVRRPVPVISDLKPSGVYMATDLQRGGHRPQVLRSCLTPD
jgi:dihydroxy-acid dehydratase